MYSRYTSCLAIMTKQVRKPYEVKINPLEEFSHLELQLKIWGYLKIVVKN